jgi:hypothetical protein
VAAEFARLSTLPVDGVFDRVTSGAALSIPQIHPVAEQLAPLFTFGGLVRGSLVGLSSPALALDLLSPISQAGGWCAITGIPDLGLAAVAEAGLDLRRLVLIPDPGAQWASVVATQLDGFEAILFRAPRRASITEARRLAARARERGSTLFVLGHWPQQVDLSLRIEQSAWIGLSHGYGRLTGRECTLLAEGRGAAARARRATVRLPLRNPS